MFARTPGTYGPGPAGAASPSVGAGPWGGSSADRPQGGGSVTALWSRFHDGGGHSAVSRVEAKELTERVAHLERDRGLLLQELRAAQQVRADWESALHAAEAKVLQERSEHASVVTVLQSQLRETRAEVEVLRGELAQAQRAAQAAQEEASQSVNNGLAATLARCTAAEADAAAAQTSARALRTERDEALAAAAAALRDKHIAESALRAIHDNITAREQLADARAADAAQKIAQAEAKCAAAAAESAAAAAAAAATAALQAGAIAVVEEVQIGRQKTSAHAGPSRGRAVPVTTHGLPSIDEEPVAPAPSAVAQGRRKTSSRGRAASGGAQAQSEKSPPDAGVQKAADTEAHARGGRSGAAVDAAPVAEMRRKRGSASLGDDVSTDSRVRRSTRSSARQGDGQNRA